MVLPFALSGAIMARIIDAVLLDAGGVIVDPNWARVAELLAERGIAVDPARLIAAEPIAKHELDVAHRIGQTSDAARRATYLASDMAAGGLDGDPDAIADASAQMEREHLERGIWDVVRPGTSQALALARLRGAGLRVALASRTISRSTHEERFRSHGNLGRPDTRQPGDRGARPRAAVPHRIRRGAARHHPRRRAAAHPSDRGRHRQ